MAGLNADGGGSRQGWPSAGYCGECVLPLFHLPESIPVLLYTWGPGHCPFLLFLFSFLVTSIYFSFSYLIFRLCIFVGI